MRITAHGRTSTEIGDLGGARAGRRAGGRPSGHNTEYTNTTVQVGRQAGRQTAHLLAPETRYQYGNFLWVYDSPRPGRLGLGEYGRGGERGARCDDDVTRTLQSLSREGVLLPLPRLTGLAHFFTDKVRPAPRGRRKHHGIETGPALVPNFRFPRPARQAIPTLARNPRASAGHGEATLYTSRR